MQSSPIRTPGRKRERRRNDSLGESNDNLSPHTGRSLANIYRIKTHHFNVDAKHPGHNDGWAVKSNSTSPMSGPLRFLTLSFQFFIFISLWTEQMESPFSLNRQTRCCRRIRSPRHYGDKWKFRCLSFGGVFELWSPHKIHDFRRWLSEGVLRSSFELLCSLQYRL